MLHLIYVYARIMKEQLTTEQILLIVRYSSRRKHQYAEEAQPYIIYKELKLHRSVALSTHDQSQDKGAPE